MKGMRRLIPAKVKNTVEDIRVRFEYAHKQGYVSDKQFIKANELCDELLEITSKVKRENKKDET